MPHISSRAFQDYTKKKLGKPDDTGRKNNKEEIEQCRKTHLESDRRNKLEMGARLEKLEQTVLDDASFDLLQNMLQAAWDSNSFSKSKRAWKTTKSMRMHKKLKPQESM